VRLDFHPTVVTALLIGYYAKWIVWATVITAAVIFVVV
jgi:hypothetical protein